MGELGHGVSGEPYDQGMVECVVINEVGQAWDALGEELRSVVQEVVPTVESVTGLGVGERVVVRMVSPAMQASLTSRMYRSVIQQMLDSAEPGELTAKDLGATRTVMPTIVFAMMRLLWPTVGGQYMSDGGPGEFVFVPRGMRHIPRTVNGIRRIVSHELTHQAQESLAPGAKVRESLHTMVADERRHFGEVYEGHAQWAQVRVCEELYGNPLREPELQPGKKVSWRVRLTSTIAPRVPGLSEKAASYNRGEAFVQAVIDHGGTELMNQIWSELEMFPTTDELDDPALWIERCATNIAEPVDEKR